MWPRLKTTGTYNQSYPLYPYEKPYENNNMAIIGNDQTVVGSVVHKKNYLKTKTNKRKTQLPLINDDPKESKEKWEELELWFSLCGSCVSL